MMFTCHYLQWGLVTEGCIRPLSNTDSAEFDQLAATILVKQKNFERKYKLISFLGQARFAYGVTFVVA